MDNAGYVCLHTRRLEVDGVQVGRLQSQKALLFEKRSKNFGQLVAVLSRMETYIGKRFWFFFAKKKPLSWRRPVIEFLGMRCLVVSLNLSGEFLVRRARV